MNEHINVAAHGSTAKISRMHAAISVALLAIGAEAMAQAPEGALETITVTAQKRSENLQVVPISVQTLTANDLEVKGITTVSDINMVVPGISLQPYPGNSDVLYTSIRGVSANQALITIPLKVAVHINGVSVPLPIGLNTAMDMDRVEILNGPQGVLSGHNATGGALNISTAKPDLGDLWFKQQLSFASREQFMSKTVVNVPLGDTLAAKISYIHSSQDNEGISNSAPGGFHIGDKKADSARLDIRWKPSANVLVDYGYDYGVTKGHQTPFQCARPFDPSMLPIMPGCTPEYSDTLYQPFQMAKNKNLAEGHTLNVAWEASPTLTVKSITGVRRVDVAGNSLQIGMKLPGLAPTPWLQGTVPMNIVGGATAFNGEAIQNKAKLDSISQEFNLFAEVSKSLKFTAGLYYSKDTGSQSEGPYPTAFMAHVVPPSAGLPFGAGIVRTQDNGINSMLYTSTALFGQLSWRPEMFERKLEIVPGLRYTKDHREAEGYNRTGAQYLVTQTATPMQQELVGAPILLPGINLLDPGAGINSMKGNKSYTNTSPAITFNYHFDDTLMAYAKYATAYTAGGFDPTAVDTQTYSNGFAPEKVKSFELGLKGEFLERRLRSNIAVYQSKYTDEQRTVPVLVNNAPNWVVLNAGGSTYSGIEYDLTAKITKDLRLSFNASLMDQKYTRYVIGGVDKAAETKMIVPKLSYAATLDYRFPQFGLPGKLEGSLSVYHTDASSTSYTPSEMPPAFDPSWVTTPARTIWSGRLTLSQIKAGPGSLSFALWVNNLTDKKYSTITTMTSASGSSIAWGEPRTVGLDAVYRF